MTNPIVEFLSRRPVPKGCCVDPRLGCEVSSWVLFDSVPDGTDVCGETVRQYHARKYGKCQDVAPPCRSSVADGGTCHVTIFDAIRADLAAQGIVLDAADWLIGEGE